ncbi:MAG TPA: ribonuclease III [Candidatus Fimimorpha excrementavium]|nr:ribonuclease III [Candidatus Fimimorpha excrementavium]
MEQKLAKLEETIGYQFRNVSLIKQAMIHSSFTNEHHMNKLACNERLEFLGDSVLEVVSSDFLYRMYPNKPEGELTKMRASMVCEPTLAMCARDIQLGNYLLLGKGEDATGGRKRDSVISDAMEALIGAIYLDGGFANAKEFIEKFVLNDVENKQLFYDSKTILQEIVQREYGTVLSYRMLAEEGPEHDKHYTMQAMIGEQSAGVGTGRTKKAAQQMAAYQTILSLKKR